MPHRLSGRRPHRPQSRRRPTASRVGDALLVRRRLSSLPLCRLPMRCCEVAGRVARAPREWDLPFRSCKPARACLRVTARVLRVCMRRAIRKHYGGGGGCQLSKRATAGSRPLARRFGMSLRRKTNGKHASVAARISQCRRWHARFRRRLSRAPTLPPLLLRCRPHRALRRALRGCAQTEATAPSRGEVWDEVTLLPWLAEHDLHE